MSTRRRQRRAMGDINMVPFIDVMLVLLVIFMVTAPLITTGDIDLPSVSQAPPSPDKPRDVLTLGIQSESQYKLSSQRRGQLAQGSDLGDLITQIQAEQSDNPELAIVIAASKDLRYETVVQAMDGLRSHNIQRIGLVVAQKQP